MGDPETSGLRCACLRLQETVSCFFHPPVPEAALATPASRGAGSWGASAICYRHHSTAPGLGPGDSASGAPGNRGCEADLERRCRLLGHPGATYQAQVRVPSRSGGAKVRARHVSGAGRTTAGLPTPCGGGMKLSWSPAAPRRPGCRCRSVLVLRPRTLLPGQRAQASEPGEESA